MHWDDLLKVLRGKKKAVNQEFYSQQNYLSKMKAKSRHSHTIKAEGVDC